MMFFIKVRHKPYRNHGLAYWKFLFCELKTIISFLSIAEIIRRVVDYLKDHQNSRIIYRNTHIGHPNCYDHPSPVLEESSFPSLSAGAYKSFTWDKFDSFNSHADEAFTSIGAKILKTDRMTRSRFDGHVNKDDCMHYFLPSVVDWWNVALYNMLDAEMPPLPSKPWIHTL